MTGVHAKALNKINNNEYTWTLKWSVISSMLSDRTPNDCKLLLLWDYDGFIDKWDVEIQKRGLNSMWGFVQYDNHDFIPEYDNATIQNALEVCFHKDDKYNEQSEYRLTACSRDDKDISDIKIGALAEGTYRVVPVRAGMDLQIMLREELTGDSNFRVIYLTRWVKSEENE